MKRILCYGDSNTWGQMAVGGRYASDEQWTHILQAELGAEFEVIQSGLGGRVAGDYETEQPARNGKSAYEVAYLTAYPIDLVIIALGTNDLKTKYGRSAKDIFDDLLWYKQATKQYQQYDEAKFGHPTGTKVLFVAPPNFVQHLDRPGRDESERQELIELLRGSGEQVLVMNDLTMGDDGVHFTKDDHRIVAERVKHVIKEMGI